MEQVAAAIRDATVEVPGLAREKFLDVARHLLCDCAIKDDRVEGPNALGSAEGPPLVAVALVNYGHTLLTGKRSFLRLLEQLNEELGLPGEGCQGKGLPWRTRGHVNGPLLALAV